jgi:hypothetical protein
METIPIEDVFVEIAAKPFDVNICAACPSSGISTVFPTS